jgi:hypothetical protein
MNRNNLKNRFVQVTGRLRVRLGWWAPGRRGKATAQQRGGRTPHFAPCINHNCTF